MFDFLRKSGPRSPSGAILQALSGNGLPPGTDVAALGVVESRGSYSGRTVTFFRAFDPTRAAGRSADVVAKFTYADLESHPELVLASGHVERDGAVVLHQSRRPAEEGTAGLSPDAAPSSRQRADRAAHADDERFVFPDTDQARKEARS